MPEENKPASAPAWPTATGPASPQNQARAAPAAPGADQGSNTSEGPDLHWVWREVRKRVFIKLPFSLGLADAMEAIVPITLDDDTFVVGLTTQNYALSSHLVSDQVRNTIENILRQAAKRYIRLEIIEGITIDDWLHLKRRRQSAQEAVIAMAEQAVQEHHFEDVLNQIVGEIRRRITSERDRNFPQVRAKLVLDVVTSLADAEEMLFADPDQHDARRAMSRALDRISSALEVQPIMLAIEIERYRRANPTPGRPETSKSLQLEPPTPQ